jgi:hypothetical protein
MLGIGSWQNDDYRFLGSLDELIRYKKIELVAQFVYGLAVARSDGFVAGAIFRLPMPPAPAKRGPGGERAAARLIVQPGSSRKKASADGVAR